MSSTRSGEQQDVPSYAYTLYSEQVPEFWIYDNYQKNLEGNQEFTITVKRRSERFHAADYVKIYLLERTDPERPESFTLTRQSKLYGTKKKRWNGQLSITFDDLAMITSGIFRIQVDIMRHTGVKQHDLVLETLYSKDIVFPEVVV